MLRESSDASFLLHSLMDGVVDQYFPIVEKYDKQINELQDLVLITPKTMYTKTLHVIAKELAQLRRALHPTIQLVSTLRQHRVTVTETDGESESNSCNTPAFYSNSTSSADDSSTSSDQHHHKEGGSPFAGDAKAGEVGKHRDKDFGGGGDETLGRNVSSSASGSPRDELEKEAKRKESERRKKRDRKVKVKDKKKKKSARQVSLISKVTRTYLGDVNDHITGIVENFKSLEDDSKELIDLIFNTVSHSTNESMKSLAVVSAFFLPLTFLVGYYG
ncbi:hypothetical protein HK102_005098, partial [Quaeritorhiza haematococci]